MAASNRSGTGVGFQVSPLRVSPRYLTLNTTDSMISANTTAVNSQVKMRGRSLGS